MNRLARERSPYLLQHANNPVDWFPWGDEAFAKARAEDKPIFLSIGYSTCHWCHVMEHESFENDDDRARAERALRVDQGRSRGAAGRRSRLHDVRAGDDRIRRLADERLADAGAEAVLWRHLLSAGVEVGRPGFVDILQEIARVWRAERDKVVESAEPSPSSSAPASTPRAAWTSPGADALQRTVEQFRQSFDAGHGGFGDAPKFPRPSELLFLLREHARTGDADAARMVRATLRAMALGGMRDHIGGGFHRYSVDAAWRVPHFEKMLYDQAQLVLAYVEGAQASRRSVLLEVAEDTLRYVLREMTDRDGGFYLGRGCRQRSAGGSRTDHAHKAEGAFYLWRAESSTSCSARTPPSSSGGSASRAERQRAGRSAAGVHRQEPAVRRRTRSRMLADGFGIGETEVEDVLARARLAMFAARLERPRPHLDDKVLTAWNGLMIAAFARAGRVKQGRGEDGARLYRRGAAGGDVHPRAHVGPGRADAPAPLSRGRGRHRGVRRGLRVPDLRAARAVSGRSRRPSGSTGRSTLQHRQDELFWDEAGGGWFSTTGRDPSVLLRMKEDYDGAEPTASSVSVLNLLMLSHLSEDHAAAWRRRSTTRCGCSAQRLEQVGRGVPMMAAALSAYAAGLQQIVVVGEGDDAALMRTVANRYLPFATTLALTEERHGRSAVRCRTLRR